MSKHDKEKQAKQARNEAYAVKMFGLRRRRPRRNNSDERVRNALDFLESTTSGPYQRPDDWRQDDRNSNR